MEICTPKNSGAKNVMCKTCRFIDGFLPWGLIAAREYALIHRESAGHLEYTARVRIDQCLRSVVALEGSNQQLFSSAVITIRAKNMRR